MSRLPLTVRMLLLLPLLATAVDLTRATLACGSQAQTCLAAAGHGWLGGVAVALVPLYAFAFALIVARAARGLSVRRGAPGRVGFAKLWLLGSIGIAAVCLGQMALAGVEAGWPAVLALSVVGGALLALAMRVADALPLLRPTAPRAPFVARTTLLGLLEPALAVPRPPAAPARGRGPPAA